MSDEGSVLRLESMETLLGHFGFNLILARRFVHICANNVYDIIPISSIPLSSHCASRVPV